MYRTSRCILKTTTATTTKTKQCIIVKFNHFIGEWKLVRSCVKRCIFKMSYANYTIPSGFRNILSGFMCQSYWPCSEVKKHKTHKGKVCEPLRLKKDYQSPGMSGNLIKFCINL